jgi:uncharacterized membrane protein
VADTTGNSQDSAERNPAVDRLIEELEAYLGAQAQRVLVGMGRKLGETTGKLNDVVDGKGPGFAKTALEGGRKIAQGKGPLRSALELGGGRLKDTAKDAVKGLGKKIGMAGKGDKKGRSGNKPTVILEQVDVGLPPREVYDQWTQFQEFNTFAKGVKSVSIQDETTSDWTGKILWSTRSWKGNTRDQIPDERIVWTTEAAKGSHKGVVSFHALGDRLTRVLLIIEYYPEGFFEKTAGIWRAQGRRVRLDLKNFARFLTMRGEPTGAWRGEIRDGEVVRGHDEAQEETVPEDEYEQEEEEGPEDEYESEEEEGEEEGEQEGEVGEEAGEGEEEGEAPEAEDEFDGEEDEFDGEEAGARGEGERHREYEQTSGRSRR